jgi:hypothetical protein
MRVEYRYVEYIGGSRMAEGEWFSHMTKAPKWCLDVGIARKEALRRVKEFRRRDREAGCSNFEYRAV